MIAEGKVAVDGDRAIVNAPGLGVLLNPQDRA